MSLVALTPRIPNDGSSLVRFAGPANTLVSWTVQSGPGSVSPVTPATDFTGTAYAVYRPNGGDPGQAVIRASYGT